MAVKVQTIYDSVCVAMLEDYGLSLTYSSNLFLNDIYSGIVEFLKESRMAKRFDTQNVTSGTAVSLVPDEFMEVQDVFWNYRHLERSDGFDLDQSDTTWAGESGSPQVWREDQIAMNSVQVAPKPAADGVLGYIASLQPIANAVDMDDDIPLVPDDFCFYLKYFCLSKIFETEGECRDLQRAMYCRARWTECMNLAKAVVGEDVLLGA
jgi:hypothetical protein